MSARPQGSPTEKSMKISRFTLVAVAAIAGSAAATDAQAQDFCKGKTPTVIVGYSPGGGFDANAGLLARYLGPIFRAISPVAADRMKILRDAFDATMQDPDFQADATKQRLPFSPNNAEDAVMTVDEIYATPDDIAILVGAYVAYVMVNLTGFGID
jgi:tripartite-type tricarboxylate transporter receptor subunit TctC